MDTTSDLLVWGTVAHLIADWLLQNEWMAINKVDLRHPAAWAHSGIHFVCLLPIFPVGWCLLVAGAHLLIDTRKPLQWWRRIYRQTSAADNPASLHVAIWGDQVLHVMVIALVVRAMSWGPW